MNRWSQNAFSVVAYAAGGSLFQVVWVWVSREITLQMFLSSSSSSTNLDSSVFQVRKHRTVSSWLTHRVSGPGREIASSSTTNEISPEQQTIEIEFSQPSTGCRWKESGGATCALSNAAFLCFFGKWQQATVVGSSTTLVLVSVRTTIQFLLWPTTVYQQRFQRWYPVIESYNKQPCRPKMKI